MRLVQVAALAIAPAAIGVAEAASDAEAPYSIHAEIRPSVSKLGERLTYRGWVVVPHGTPVRWVIPQGEGAFSWGSPRARRDAVRGGTLDTVRIEVPLQVFAFGRVSVPGLRLRLSSTSAPGGVDEHALPVARLTVVPEISPLDTSSVLRPVRGPVSAPWWERVPWILVGSILALLAVLIALFVALRRRRPRVVAPEAVAAPARRRDPAAEALTALAALRRLKLPEQGRFGEHAFQLTRIVRRFLEATTGGIRPGYTTSELVAMLSGSPAKLDVARLEGLLRLWDFIKFARGSSTVEEAHQAEDAVESMLRSPVSPQREVA
jgi:hypothetical protein